MSKSSLVDVNVPAYEGNFTYGRDGRKIEAITIHHMAGRLTAENCGRIFQQEGRCGSSHYGIGYDGKIAQYVDESNTAWTNSNWDSNCKSVTIETSDNDNSWYVNDTTLNSLIRLVADIAKRNNLGTLVKGRNVTWHSMYANTDCPGAYLLSKMDYIITEANKLNNIKLKDSDVYYQVYTDRWLPNVLNREDYAGIFGKSIYKLYINSSNDNHITYQVHEKGKDWLPEVVDRTDYAGWNSPIDGIKIKSSIKDVYYQVHLLNGDWLPEVKNYDDYAGIYGRDIDGLYIRLEDKVEEPKEIEIKTLPEPPEENKKEEPKNKPQEETKQEDNTNIQEEPKTNEIKQKNIFIIKIIVKILELIKKLIKR